jgi:hypothetical protein
VLSPSQLRYMQDAGQIEQLAPLKNQIMGLTARVHEYEGKSALHDE